MRKLTKFQKRLMAYKQTLFSSLKTINELEIGDEIKSQTATLIEMQLDNLLTFRNE